MNIKSDSRKIELGDTFIALDGVKHNGSEYIMDAIQRGASRVICKEGDYDVETVLVPDTHEYLIDYLQNLMENRSISVIKNYAIISYDGTYDKAIEELNRKSLSFTGNLLRAKIICEILNENELYNLIYRELNKNSVINISALKEGGKNLYVGKKQKAKRNKHI